jgi:hypothetical protein
MMSSLMTPIIVARCDVVWPKEILLESLNDLYELQAEYSWDDTTFAALYGIILDNPGGSWVLCVPLAFSVNHIVRWGMKFGTSIVKQRARFEGLTTCGKLFVLKQDRNKWITPREAIQIADMLQHFDLPLALHVEIDNLISGEPNA